MRSNRIAPPLPGAPAPLAWWHYRIVWFALGLPALVVVASLYTAGLAWRHADEQVFDPRPARVAAEDVVERGHPANALEPAERARNHAATPGQ